MNVTGNFSCGKIEKKKGEILSDSEIEQISDHLPALLAAGCIEPSKKIENEVLVEQEAAPAYEGAPLEEQSGKSKKKKK